MPTGRQILLFLKLSRPHFLVGGFLLYGLGASIASYLGRPIDLGLYALGQALVTAIQLMTHYLNEYFDSPADRDNPKRTPLSGGSGALGPDGLPRKVALYAGILSLALAATIVSAALVSGAMSVLAWMLLILIFLGAYFYSAPPLRLISSGYGEIAASVVVAGLLPSFSYAVQTGEIHRLLLMSTTPLMALSFAMLLVFELPDYATDLKHAKRTFMVRLGWEAAMRAHDLAVVFALLSLAVGYLNGLPPRVALGALIATPLGLAQVWQMRRIRMGFPPRWTTLTASALALFALTAYLELAGYLLS
jgi:1,4-dihydroxy-2-naphthoate octaprenyltransferase